MNNVPLHIIESLPDEELDAWSIIVGELNGGEWDWRLNEWKKSDR